MATKVGNRRIPGKEGWVWDPSKVHIRSAVKESLKRLGTDYIDLYQLHGGTIEDPIEETIEAFEELKKDGLIRYYGISSIRPNVIREYVRRSNITSLMSQYSMLDRRPEEEVLPQLMEHEIGLIARGPLAGGILTSGGANKANETIAIRYVRSEPGVTVTIPGASSLEQLRNNVSAAGTPLSADERDAIQAATRANRYTIHR